MKLKELKKKDFENKFASNILERGKKYFRDGRIGKIIVTKDKIKAKVDGSMVYDIEMDLNYSNLNCTCPYFYGSGNCKHLAAVFYELLDNPSIDYLENSFANLEKISKEQLVNLIKEMVEEEPKLRYLIKRAPPEIMRELENFQDLIDQHDDFGETLKYVKYLRKIIRTFTGETKFNLLEELFSQLYESYHDYGDLSEPLEDIMYEIMEEISVEINNLDKEKREKIIKKMKGLQRTDDTYLRDYVFEPLEKYFR
ncbi:MAG: SWIM zinc finger family protein [Candidatus Aenigmarchaeota archaeon]|nr:SWIM zinc finger family protein [Candidatus Aenigmarchaeota archaeon]